MSKALRSGTLDRTPFLVISQQACTEGGAESVETQNRKFSDRDSAIEWCEENFLKVIQDTFNDEKFPTEPKQLVDYLTDRVLGQSNLANPVLEYTLIPLRENLIKKTRLRASKTEERLVVETLKLESLVPGVLKRKNNI